MKRVPPNGAALQGIDVFHGNPITSFKGNAFVFLKATEGETYTDPAFRQRWGQLRTEGIRRGAYHFFRPSTDPVTQAQHFAQVLGPLELADLPPVLDLEVLDGRTISIVRFRVAAFLHKLRELTRRVPIIYGSPYFLQDLNLPQKDIGALWIANYNTLTPLVPGPWETWTFWQYSDAGLDRNYFNGGQEELAKFIAGSRI